MNKKRIASLTPGSPTPLATLMGLSKSLVSLIASIPTNPDPDMIRMHPGLKAKRTQLQSSLKKGINSLGKLTATQKGTMSGVMQYSADIMESISDLIQTSVKKYKESKSNAAVIKGIQEGVKVGDKQQNTLHNPQPHPNFQPHTHKIDLTQIRLDQQVVKPSSLENKCIYVSTLEELRGVKQILLKEREIAVDLQHSPRSYNGFTCLMQISTRAQDYIIDVLPLWEHIGLLLGDIFMNPHIIKVMHGAEMDVKWLQRDFNIHVGGLFDTYKASRVMGFVKHSLAYLLHYYCQVTADKSFQLADWRQRPLTGQMLHYARIDTHYLLYIFDRLRVDIRQMAVNVRMDPERSLIGVYESSHQVTLGEVQLFNYKNKEIFSNLKRDMKEKDFGIMEDIFELIDGVARKEDIAFDDLLPKKTLSEIVSRVKDLLIDKKIASRRIKIDKLINILRTSQNHSVGLFVGELKNMLDLKFTMETDSEVKIEKIPVNTQNHPAARVHHIMQEEEENRMHKQLIDAERKPLIFTEYASQSYANPNLNPFCMISFEPIMAFLSNKLGIAPVNQKKEEMEEEIEQEESEEGEEAEEKLEEEPEEQPGIIQFKRMNPNVIYTMEEEEIKTLKEAKPRKKRKELEYEERLKNKSGNIFQLLQQ